MDEEDGEEQHEQDDHQIQHASDIYSADLGRPWHERQVSAIRARGPGSGCRLCGVGELDQAAGEFAWAGEHR
jgi:hypothetical protein